MCGIKTIGVYYKAMDYTQKKLPEISHDRDWIQESMLKRYEFSMTSVNRLVSKEFIQKNSLFFEEGYIHEDELWNLAISQVIRTAAFLKKNTYNYVIRENSITTSVTDNNSLILNRKFRIYNRLLDNIRGYRKGMQLYYVCIYINECLGRIRTLGNCINLMKISFRAILKTDRMYAMRIMRIVLSWNRFAILKILNLN